MQQTSGWYSANRTGLREPGGMTWAEADRSWMKAKGRSIRTVLDSVDLMETRAKSRRRRKAAAAIFVAAAGLGLAALLAFASGGSSSDGPALASDDDPQQEQQLQDPGASTTGGADLAVSAEVSPASPAAPALAVSVTGSGGPGGGSITGGGGVNTPANPFDNVTPPINGGGGNGSGGNNGGGDNGGDNDGGGDDGSGGDDSLVSGSVGLDNPLDGDLLNVGGAVSGLLDVDSEVGGVNAGDLGLDGVLPETDILPDSDGNLLDIDISGDPENTDDPLDADVDVNAGGTNTNINDDDLLGDVLGAF